VQLGSKQGYLNFLDFDLLVGCFLRLFGGGEPSFVSVIFSSFSLVSVFCELYPSSKLVSDINNSLSDSINSLLFLVQGLGLT